MYILWDNHSFIIGGPGYCEAVESVLTVIPNKGVFVCRMLVKLVITVHAPSGLISMSVSFTGLSKISVTFWGKEA